MTKPNFAAMTTNERLADAGLLNEFDSAVQVGSRVRLIDCLVRIDFDRETAKEIADKVLANPTRYGRLEDAGTHQ